MDIESYWLVGVGLKEEFLDLLERDREFRYAIAGLIGIKEILNRLDKHEEELVKLREDLNKLREDMNRGFEIHWKAIERLREDMNKGLEHHWNEIERLREDLNNLREDMNKGFEHHWKEIQKLREDMNKGFELHWKEIKSLRRDLNQLRDDMNKGFEHHWSEIKRLREDLNNLREDMNRGFEHHWREIERLREDMNKGFDSINRLISSLGARWGVMTEEAVRSGLEALIEREFGYKVGRWRKFDGEGYVYGYPSDVEVDVAIHDDKIILIEVKSHVNKADISIFNKKREFYEKMEAKKVSRMIVISPYVDEEALELAKKLKIEVYLRA